ITTVDFDGFGPKRVPRVCLNCHGEGAPPAPLGQIGAPVVDLGSSFREYDRTVSIPPAGISLPAFDTALYDANQIVRQTDNRPLRNELIDGWYASGPVQDPNFVTSGWSGSLAEAKFYREVLAKSCRTCHIALPGRYWETLEVLAGEAPYGWVCSPFRMPHALPTYLNFWRSDRPTLMEDFFTTEVPDVYKWTMPCLSP
ncbi:MAG: hypothetical protein HY701_03550, partial [Gemmatimonadetes bacterium]|nr:hypothetical protein [Gemmatimonadota bacterium]